MARPSKYTKKECIEALYKAKEKLGEVPSHNQYESLDIKPSGSTIQNKFNGWNNAKEAANMKTEIEPRAYKKPKLVDYTDKEWKSLSSNVRTKHRKSAKLAKMKMRRGCNRCGYNKCRYALDWHHINKKNNEISNMLSNGVSMEKIMKEIEQCEVVCANCHREITSSNY